MRDELMQRAHVLIDIARDPVAARSREPVQRQPLQMIGEARAQPVAQIGVDAVREVQRERLAAEPARAGRNRRREPRARRAVEIGRGAPVLGDPAEREPRHERRDARERLQRDRGRERRRERTQHPGKRRVHAARSSNGSSVSADASPGGGSGKPSCAVRCCQTRVTSTLR